MYADRLIRSHGGTVRLVGARCAACGTYAFPARVTCAACGARELPEAELSGRGTVHAAARVETPPAGFDGPYVFAAIDLEEGPRTFGILLAEPTGGLAVEAVPAPLRDQVPGFAFAPVTA